MPTVQQSFTVVFPARHNQTQDTQLQRRCRVSVDLIRHGRRLCYDPLMMNDRLVVSDQTVSNAPMAWHAVALDLPRLHTALTKGDVGAAQRPIDELPSLQGAPVPDEDNATLREHVLDVLMVEGFVRRHVAPLGLDLHTRVLGEARRAADRLGMHPIISYPLYIRANSMAPDSMRCFTPYAGEARFIRMHRFHRGSI